MHDLNRLMHRKVAHLGSSLLPVMVVLGSMFVFLEAGSYVSHGILYFNWWGDILEFPCTYCRWLLSLKSDACKKIFFFFLLFIFYQNSNLKYERERERESRDRRQRTKDIKHSCVSASYSHFLDGIILKVWIYWWNELQCGNLADQVPQPFLACTFLGRYVIW